MDNIKMQIGQNIRTVRKERHMTLSQVADAVHLCGGNLITGQAVGAWERGENAIPADQIYYLAKALDCSVAYLYHAGQASDGDNRVLSEVQALQPDEVEIVQYAFRRWRGNKRALLMAMGALAAPVKAYREDAVLQIILTYERAVRDGKVDPDAPAVDLDYLTEQWRHAVRDGRRR